MSEFSPLRGGDEGCGACDDDKQDKGRGRRRLLQPVTTARSAGSYGDFYVAVKWGQKQQAGITFAVTFPECLEAWTKSRGHAGDTYSFLLLYFGCGQKLCIYAEILYAKPWYQHPVG